MAQGRIPVQWKVVSAPVSGNLIYRVKKGSSGWWAAIQVREHRYPVLKLEICQDGTWLNLPKRNYNYFVGTRLGNQPLSMRMTDIRGQTLIDTLPALPKKASSKAYSVNGEMSSFPNKTVTGSAWFSYLSGDCLNSLMRFLKLL